MHSSKGIGDKGQKALIGAGRDVGVLVRRLWRVRWIYLRMFVCSPAEWNYSPLRPERKKT